MNTLNNYYTKMPKEVETMKVLGLGALALYSLGTKKQLFPFSAIWLVGSLNRSYQDRSIRWLQIATEIGLLVCTFKKFHRGAAALYTLTAGKIIYDYKYREDAMIKEIEEMIAGKNPKTMQIANPKKPFGEIQDSYKDLEAGWGKLKMPDGRMLYLYVKVQNKAFTFTTTKVIPHKDVSVFIEKISPWDLPKNYPWIATLAAALFNKEQNEFTCDPLKHFHFAKGESAECFFGGKLTTR